VGGDARAHRLRRDAAHLQALCLSAAPLPPLGMTPGFVPGSIARACILWPCFDPAAQPQTGGSRRLAAAADWQPAAKLAASALGPVASARATP
jgi:hypothetical protein